MVRENISEIWLSRTSCVNRSSRLEKARHSKHDILSSHMGKSDIASTLARSYRGDAVS